MGGGGDGDGGLGGTGGGGRGGDGDGGGGRGGRGGGGDGGGSFKVIGLFEHCPVVSGTHNVTDAKGPPAELTVILSALLGSTQVPVDKCARR